MPFPDLKTVHTLREELGSRLPEAYINERLSKEHSYGFSLRDSEPWPRYIFAKNIKYAVKTMAKWLRIEKKGTQNALDLRVHSYDFRLPKLPPALDGLRILHLGDTHPDILPAMTPILLKKIKTLDYDLCIHTGDFRDRSIPHWEAALAHTYALLEVIKKPMYCVLGNHDLLSMVAPLETAGARFLINEHTPITQRDTTFYLAGVDDPYHYKLNSLPQADEGLTRESFKLILSHEPHAWEEAQARGYSMMFSGHTHGGQINLSREKPTLRNATCLPHMLRGSWREGELQGYTTWGIGCSGAAIRFACPPEVALHTLRCK